jgi:isocitrate/isopropylmalate dehydrogenase
VRDASVFDVIVTTNMFGDILSDQASEISGSIGLAASINASNTHAIAQAQHGSAPDIAGQDRANPSSLIGSVAMMFDWMSEKRQDPRLASAASLIDRALHDTISVAEWRTADLGGPLGTRAFGERVAQVATGLAGEYRGAA